VPADVLALKAQPGGDIVLGGSNLGAAFARQDLVEEYRLYVHPTVIGRGKQALHPSGAKVLLQLAETHTFGNGVVMLRYQRRRSGTAG
jgi:riboflavin biosynthesis pyrimidine reductase